MGNERVYNFSAGPSMLPLEVLERAGAEITNYQGSGMSVMEMSHRSKVFQKIFDDTKAKLRALLNVPEGYQILFLQGGASTQFSMAPLNLIGATGKADYAVTGNFSNIAYKEAQKYGHRGTNQPVQNLETGRVYISSQNHGYAVVSSTIDPEIADEYFNNVNDRTCEGVRYKKIPAFSVQFHPEACGGPRDTAFLFDKFFEMMGK